MNESYEPVKVSCYDDNMNRWLKFYTLDQFLLLQNEEMSKEPVTVLKKVEKFLGLKPHFKQHHFQTTQVNKAKKPYNYLSNDTRKILTNYFRPHMINFYHIVNMTFDWKLYP